MTKLAFIGTGLIGGSLAEAALGRGDEVVVWNRSRPKAEALAAKGAHVATHPAAAVRGAERVHVTMSADDALDAVLARIDRLDDGAVLCDHTTASPAGTRARAHALADRGIPYLHVPVFMSPAACREAKGVMVVAGPEDRFARVREGLAAMTGDVWWVGERADLAAAYKLFGNAMILMITGALADTLTLARRLDVAPADAYALFERFDPAVTLRGRGAKMAAGDFATSFALTMARKDVQLMLDAADGDGALALLPALARRMDAVIAEGRGDDDVGVLAAAAFRADGT